LDITPHILDKAIQLVEAQVANRLANNFTVSITPEILLSEFDAIRLLDPLELVWAKPPMLAIFQKHFLVRNCFYRFCAKSGKHATLDFSISALGLEVRQLQAEAPAAQYVGHTSGFLALEAFYLELDNFHKATEDTVAELLSSFWTKYHALDECEASLQVLNLESDVSWEDISKRYRVLAQQHHPDRGGDSEQFIKIKKAYTMLKQVYKP